MACNVFKSWPRLLAVFIVFLVTEVYNETSTQFPTYVNAAHVNSIRWKSNFDELSQQRHTCVNAEEEQVAPMDLRCPKEQSLEDEEGEEMDSEQNPEPDEPMDLTSPLRNEQFAGNVQPNEPNDSVWQQQQISQTCLSFMKAKLRELINNNRTTGSSAQSRNSSTDDGAAHDVIRPPFLPFRKSDQAVMKQCFVCHQVFRQHVDLHQHMSVHGGVLPHRCRICGRGFSVRCNMQRHERIKHKFGVLTQEMELSSICTICGKYFPGQCALRIHSVVHTRERPYECSFCGRRFSAKNGCVRHEKDKHRIRNVTETATEIHELSSLLDDTQS